MNFIDQNTIQSSYQNEEIPQSQVIFGKNFNPQNPDLDPCVVNIAGQLALVAGYAEGTVEGENVIELALHVDNFAQMGVEDFTNGLPTFLMVIVEGQCSLYINNSFNPAT